MLISAYHIKHETRIIQKKNEFNKNRNKQQITHTAAAAAVQPTAQPNRVFVTRFRQKEACYNRNICGVFMYIKYA